MGIVISFVIGCYFGGFIICLLGIRKRNDMLKIINELDRRVKGIKSEG